MIETQALGLKAQRPKQIEDPVLLLQQLKVLICKQKFIQLYSHMKETGRVYD